jgi:RNA recognition motif-containing protein
MPAGEANNTVCGSTGVSEFTARIISGVRIRPALTRPLRNLNRSRAESRPPFCLVLNLSMERKDKRRKVFVGGLSWDTNEASLVAYFERFGKVIDAVVMRNRETGQPRGFGFVTFEEEGLAQAVASLERHELDGRLVETKVAVPKSAEDPESNTVVDAAQRYGPSGLGEKPSRRVYVSGLPQACTEDDLRAFFSRFGSLEAVRVVVDHHTGLSKGYGFVVFAETAASQKVQSLDPENFVIRGSAFRVKVRCCRNNESSRPKHTNGNPWGLTPDALLKSAHDGNHQGYSFADMGVDTGIVAQYLHAVYGGDLAYWEKWAREVRTANRPQDEML